MDDKVTIDGCDYYLGRIMSYSDPRETYDITVLLDEDGVDVACWFFGDYSEEAAREYLRDAATPSLGEVCFGGHDMIDAALSQLTIRPLGGE